MKTGLAIATLGLLLAGCGQNSKTANDASVVHGTASGPLPAAGSTADPMESKIDALTDKQRKLTFYKAIYDADYQCDEVTRIADKPRDNGHRAWMATCATTCSRAVPTATACSRPACAITRAPSMWR